MKSGRLLVRVCVFAVSLAAWATCDCSGALGFYPATRPPKPQSSESARKGGHPGAKTRNARAIRKVDFEKFLAKGFKEECPEYSWFVRVTRVEYYDLDGDGKEEAVVTAWSCLSGTGGADIVEVYKLTNRGRLVTLRLDESKTFEGRDVWEGAAGHFYLGIEDGKLLGSFPIYKPGDANCCPSGGRRQLTYKWDGRQFRFAKLEDFPPEE